MLNTMILTRMVCFSNNCFLLVLYLLFLEFFFFSLVSFHATVFSSLKNDGEKKMNWDLDLSSSLPSLYVGMSSGDGGGTCG